MKFQDELNPIIWDKDNDNQMRPEVNAKLREIADAFIEYIEIPEEALIDVVVTGSSASYNYNEHSDLDLHIIVDYDKIHEDCPLVEGYLGALKNTFNKEHDIYIKDVPVELYAEKLGQGTIHNGLYSVWKEEWIDRPEKIEPTDNDAAVEAKYQEIKEMVDKCDDSEVATELLEKIYTMRKAGLAEAGEFCTENLAFKKLRNEGCMDKLRKLKKEQIDKQLSLESYNESNRKDRLYGPYDGFIWEQSDKGNSYIVHTAFDGGLYNYLGHILFNYYNKELNLVRLEVLRKLKDERDYSIIFSKKCPKDEMTIEQMQDKIEDIIKVDHSEQIDKQLSLESYNEDTQKLSRDDFKIIKTENGLYKVDGGYDSRLGYIKPDKSYMKVDKQLGNAIYKYNTRFTQTDRKALMSKLHKLFKEAGIPKMKDMTSSIRGYRPITQNGYYMDIYAGDRTSFNIGISKSNDEWINKIKEILDQEGINYWEGTDHFSIDMEKQNKNESIKESEDDEEDELTYEDKLIDILTKEGWTHTNGRGAEMLKKGTTCIDLYVDEVDIHKGRLKPITMPLNTEEDLQNILKTVNTVSNKNESIKESKMNETLDLSEKDVEQLTKHFRKTYSAEAVENYIESLKREFDNIKWYKKANWKDAYHFDWEPCSFEEVVAGTTRLRALIFALNTTLRDPRLPQELKGKHFEDGFKAELPWPEEFNFEENKMNEAEGIYKPSLILEAYKKEQEWLKSLNLGEDERAPEIMLFIIENDEIKDTKLIKREDVYTYKPEENEYYLDMFRDSGDVLTDYNLEPAQKLIDRWNEFKKEESMENKNEDVATLMDKVDAADAELKELIKSLSLREELESLIEKALEE